MAEAGGTNTTSKRFAFSSADAPSIHDVMLMGFVVNENPYAAATPVVRAARWESVLRHFGGYVARATERKEPAAPTLSARVKSLAVWMTSCVARVHRQ